MAAPIYLDYQATTPLAPEARAAMLPYLDGKFGNPHSDHRFGWEADAGVEAARGQIAALLGVAPATLLFTSGATEAANLAIKGVLSAPDQTRRRIVTLATEHSCVLESARWLESVGAELTVLGVDGDGLVRLDELATALRDDVALVAVAAVNNEIGVIQPLAEIAAMAKAAGALMFVDGAQAFGKLALNPADFDLLSLSAHKIYGPKGVGALYVRPGTTLAPQQHGGGQEGGGLRSGTLSPALCAGFGAAAKVAQGVMADDAAHAATLWDRMLGQLEVPFQINGSQSERWRGNLNVSFPGIDGARLLSDVLREVALSSGAACASAKGKASHVLAALGLPEPLARATLRIGWGRYSTIDEIDRAAAAINRALRAQGQRAA